VVAGGNESTPAGGDSLPLDGIGCVDCCSGMDLLALAEQPPAAKVVVCRYSDRKVLATLIGECKLSGEFDKNISTRFCGRDRIIISDSEIMTRKLIVAEFTNVPGYYESDLNPSSILTNR